MAIVVHCKKYSIILPTVKVGKTLQRQNTRMSIGKETFELTKKDYTAKITRIIRNNRANSRLIGESREFILRSCRLTSQWLKLSSDPEVQVYLRNVEISGGRRVKMLSLERGGTRQPLSKSKLVDCLYPAKTIATTATLEEQHYNKVKGAMRNAVHNQLKEFRENCTLPQICYLSGMQIRRGMRTDVDHAGTTFSELADSFVMMKSLKYTDISLVGPPTAKRFKDSYLWEEWQEYHAAKARFALVCASANRSKGSDGYTTPEDLYGSFAKESEEDLALDF
jgi:hypothetical protein